MFDIALRKFYKETETIFFSWWTVLEGQFSWSLNSAGFSYKYGNSGIVES